MCFSGSAQSLRVYVLQEVLMMFYASEERAEGASRCHCPSLCTLELGRSVSPSATGDIISGLLRNKECSCCLP